MDYVILIALMRACKFIADDGASYHPIGILAPHTQLNYVPLMCSGMQFQCLGALYLQSFSLCQGYIEQISFFYSALWFMVLSLPMTHCAFFPPQFYL